MATRFIVGEHCAWRDSDGKKGNRLDLSNYNLDKSRFNGSDFGQAEFKECTFKEADIRKSFFEGARLGECRFFNTRFRSSDFTGANLANCKFESAVFIQSGFYKTELTDCSFPKADFSSSKFPEAKFWFCDLSTAQMRKVKMDNVQYRNRQKEDMEVLVLNRCKIQSAIGFIDRLIKRDSDATSGTNLPSCQRHHAESALKSLEQFLNQLQKAGIHTSSQMEVQNELRKSPLGAFH